MSHSQKRSRVAIAGLVGFAALTLAACEEEKAEGHVFKSEAECREEADKPNSWWTPQECAASFAQAQDRHLNNAPRYDAVDVCEEQHGEGMCKSDVVPNTGGGGGIFMPLMAGYMIGNMMNGSNNYQSSRPLYPAKTGGFRTADGATKVNGLSGGASFSKRAFKPASATVNKAPMTKASIKSRGGFGTSRTSSRSFGG